jgi:quinol monooxygenase YgiN
MSEPIVFVSHFRVKAEGLEPLRALVGKVTAQLEQEKPRTLLYLSYVDESRGEITFIHAFGDADSMAEHFAGADERSSAAYEFMEPAGWEIYGRTTAEVAEAMRRAAASAGVTLTAGSDHMAGFLRLGSG